MTDIGIILRWAGPILLLLIGLIEAEPQIPWQVIASGGTQLAGYGSLHLSATIGQTAASTIESTAPELTCDEGFWVPGVFETTGLVDNFPSADDLNLRARIVRQRILVEYNLPVSSGRLRVVDITGGVLAEQDLYARHAIFSLARDRFFTGIYFFELECAAGKKIMRLVVL